ncbi:MAG: S8 family serine peptidase [Saprospiraceae bacterium]|nr:S8 family serine peptidase [Saprospiraceae bacterium]
MKIRFRKDTNIRSDHQNTDKSPLGKVFANTVIEVEDEPYEGKQLEGDNRWWRDKNGWYYWAGETERVIENTPLIRLDKAPVPLPEAPRSEPPPRPPMPAILPQALPVPDEPVTENIPEGEWRSLELTDLDDDEPEIAPVRSVAALPPVTLVVERAPLAPPLAPQLSSPRAQRLNWGLETGRIPAQWWQEQRLSGRGVRLAILSTGADVQHPDLAALKPENLQDFTGQSAPADTHGVGSQAAIVAAGAGEIAYGVAPEAELLIGKIGVTPNAVKVEYLIEALEWVIRQKADVAALLVDFIALPDNQKEQLNAVVARALDAGIVLLAPVGNSNERKPEDRFPAALEGVISVGSHHAFNRRSDFSARSYQLDLLAPGEGLTTSGLQHEQSANLKDTAIATAFTAGFVALIKQWEKQHGLAATHDDIKALLCESAHYEGINKGSDTESGHGLLNPPAVLARLI